MPEITADRLRKEATLVGIVNGFSFYEDPDCGDEEYLWTIVGNEAKLTCYFELPTSQEAERVEDVIGYPL